MNSKIVSAGRLLPPLLCLGALLYGTRGLGNVCKSPGIDVRLDYPGRRRVNHGES
jgi:hypothetical protein